MINRPAAEGKCPGCGSLLLPAGKESETRGPDATIDVGQIDATLDSASFQPAASPADIDATMVAMNDGSQTAVDHTIDGANEASLADNPAEAAARVTRGRGSMSEGIDQQALTKWTMAAGGTENPLLSLAASQSFEYDDVPLNNHRRLAVDPKDNLADYEIVRAVGKGAMGEVFAAKQKSLNRTVALKTISADRSRNAKDQRKFLYEARITSELTHPNIVPVHDLAVGDDGAPFYSMKLVSGTPWQKVIKQKGLDGNLDIFMKVCDAMGFAHSQNVIHRDLKPENIMLGDFGEVLVMDWGLAIDLSKGHKFDLAGTPAYMSPEMARHEVEQIGSTSDIYLLGAILYQIVTGTAPHPGRSVTECVIAASSNKLIPAPDPDHPLLKIAMVAIATDPEDRYQTVSEFQDAIRDYRRHAESLTQTQRAEDTLQQGIAKQDYESFSRAMFGFSAAIELWPENAKANEGAKRARLAYGKCALEQNDFDLALQVLRPNVAGESELYEAAMLGKEQAQQRIVRIRKLTKTLAFGGGIAAAIFLLLSIWAMYEKGKATELAREQTILRAISQAKTAEALANEAEAKENELRALASEATARDALEGERKARTELASANTQLVQTNVDLDESAKALAMSLDKQLELTRTAEQAAEAERMARTQAVDARQFAEEEQRRAERARLVAEVRNYPANLSLAATQIQQRDVGRTLDVLQQIGGTQKVFANIDNAPTTKNWALDRIRLATNQDIPTYQYSGRVGRVASADLAGPARLLGLGGADGSVEILKWNGNAFEREKRLDAERCGGAAPVRQLTLASNGAWVAFAKKYDTGDRVYFWNMERDTISVLQLPGLRLEKLEQSPDGKSLIGALQDLGIRVWEVANGSLVNERPKSPKMLAQYKICDLAWYGSADPGRAVGLVEAAGKRYLGLINIFGDGELRIIQDQFSVGQQLAEIEMLDNEQVLVGERGGEIQVVTASSEGVDIYSELRDEVHKTRITRLDSSPTAEQFLSVGLEPVIQLWKKGGVAGKANFSPTLELLGHESEEVLLARFMGSENEVVSVDAGGRVFLWDLKRQADREVIARRRLPAPIVYGGGVGAESMMRSVDANGVTESWYGLNGGQVGGGKRFAYVGHTPGAVLQDFTVSADGRFAVTAALLESESNIYLLDVSPGRVREFCAWDLASRRMIRRWSDQRSGFPCVAIAPDGSVVAIGSNGSPLESVVVNLSTGEEGILLDEKGRGVRADDLAFRQDGSSRLTTTAYGGMVAEFDGTNNFKIIDYNRRYLDPPDESSQIVAADWRADRFAVMFNSGLVRIFQDDADGKLVPSVNLDIKELRLQRGQVQWSFENEQGLYRIKILATLGSGGQLVTLESDSDDRGWIEKKRQPLAGKWFIGDRQNTSSELLNSLQVEQQAGIDELLGFEVVPGEQQRIAVTKRGTVVVWQQVNEQSEINTTDGVSSRLILGRSTCVAVGANSNASRMVMGCEDGQLWFVSFEESPDGDWLALPHPFAKIEGVDVSPEGAQVVVSGIISDGQRMVWCRSLVADTPEAAAGWSIEHGISAAWKPAAEGKRELAVLCRNSENVHLRIYNMDADEPAAPSNTVKVVFRAGLEPLEIEYFAERFANPNRLASWYLAVRARESAGRGSEIQFVAEKDEQQNIPAIRLPSADVTRIAGSAENNLLAIADSDGAVSVWFVAPSVDERAFELLAIDRHRGQSVTQLSFSADGGSLISGDAGGRQYIWLSTDPSGGLSQP